MNTMNTTNNANEMDYLGVDASSVEAVSNDFTYPKGTYLLKPTKIELKRGEKMDRVAFEFNIEDIIDVDSNIDIAKLIGKTMFGSISIFNKTPEDIKQSLGAVKFAAENCGAPVGMAGTLADILNACIGKPTMHKVSVSTGKDGVARNVINWREHKIKEAQSAQA